MYLESREGTTTVRTLASRQCGPSWILACVEFVVGSRHAPRVFSGFSGLPHSTKTNISKFQFDQDRESMKIS